MDANLPFRCVGAGSARFVLESCVEQTQPRKNMVAVRIDLADHTVRLPPGKTVYLHEIIPIKITLSSLKYLDRKVGIGDLSDL